MQLIRRLSTVGWFDKWNLWKHYGDVTMGTIASQITSLAIVFSTVYLDTDQRKHQSPASLAFVWGIHRGPVNSPHKWPVTRKMFPFDDVIMDSFICPRMRLRSRCRYLFLCPPQGTSWYCFHLIRCVCVWHVSEMARLYICALSLHWVRHIFESESP